MARKLRPTHATATSAMYDWRVPLADALKLFVQAFRRSNAATRGFVLHCAGVLREAGEENYMLAAWADDGGQAEAP